MPRSPKLPDRTTQKLAEQVSGRLSPHAFNVLSNGGAVELAESFEVWFLGREAVVRPNSPLSTLAHRTGTWHHQIKHNGVATEYARSATHGPDDTDWQVHSVTWQTDLPEKIQAAIAFLDEQNAENDAVARLLVAPFFLVTAFWLEQGDTEHVLVIKMPPSFSHLVYKRVYRSRRIPPLAWAGAPSSTRGNSCRRQRSNSLPDCTVARSPPYGGCFSAAAIGIESKAYRQCRETR